MRSPDECRTWWLGHVWLGSAEWQLGRMRKEEPLGRQEHLAAVLVTCSAYKLSNSSNYINHARGSSLA